MDTNFSLQNPHDWLAQAKYFNGLWHDCLDFLIANDEQLSDSERHFFIQKEKMLLQQKSNCQIMALQLIYEHNRRSDIILKIDSDETGIAGDGVFYSLYPAEHFNLACHIPKDELLKNLTQKQHIFFGID